MYHSKQEETVRAVVQRVSRASVDVDGTTIAEIASGLLVLLGIEKSDGKEEAERLASKVVNMRIFEDSDGKMNLSVSDIEGQVLAVPQFTLAADVRKGRRPSFDNAAEPGHARRLFEIFAVSCHAAGAGVCRGAFQEHMHVSLVNDGPVTFVLESPATPGPDFA